MTGARIQPPPPWMAMAARWLGTREVPGPANSPTIMGWAKRLGAKVLGIAYGADSVPWCGRFVAQVITEAGFKPPPISVRARAWATWGEACEPVVGAVLVFERAGGGHVGFYVAERAAPTPAFRVRGGNQSDAVSDAWIPKDRLVASRWPPGFRPIGLPLKLARADGAVSTNEA